MAFWDRVLKLEKRFKAVTGKLTMIFVDDVKSLTQEQIDSPSTIYVYLEI